MADDSAMMTGEVSTWLSRRALTSRLKRSGIRAEVRDSCHYEGGMYIRIDEVSDFTMERVVPGDYLVLADADTVEQMIEAALRVSHALAGLGIRHRFEVSGDQSDVEHYLHHLWPQVDQA